MGVIWQRFKLWFMRVQRNVIFWHISTLKQYSIYLRYKRSFLCFLVDWLPCISGYRIIITCGGHSLVLIPCFIESEKGTRDEKNDYPAALYSAGSNVHTLIQIYVVRCCKWVTCKNLLHPRCLCSLLVTSLCVFMCYTATL